MAFFSLILVTPIDNTIVTTAARPSGIAATAKDTATIKTLITSEKIATVSPLAKISLCINKEKAKIKTQMPRTNLVKILDNSANLICKGVFVSLALAIASAILPISVSIPVAVTIALPRP